MSNNAQTVRYALPVTVVRVDGTVTVSTAASGEKVPMRTSEVTLATEADRDAMHELELREEWGRERDFDLKLASDERLAGASEASTGFGTEIVATGLRVAAFAAKAIARFAAAIPIDVLESVPLQEVLKRERPELARRRNEYTETIGGLQWRLLQLGERLATPDAGAETHELIKAVQTALTAARAEMSVLESQFEAWRSERFPDWTTSYTYTIGVDRLPNRPVAEDEVTLTDDELSEGQVGEVLRKLGVAIVRIADQDPTDRSDTFDDLGVRYRLPRRCELAAYEARDEKIAPGESPRLQLRRLMPAWIVDAESELGFVPFGSDLFEKHGAGAEFGDAGTLVHLTNKHTGAAAAITSAVGGAGGQVVESLEQAAKIGGAFPTAPDPALKALQDEVTRKELEAKLATARKTIAEAGNGRRAGRG